MKAIVVEGKTDYHVLEALFPDIQKKEFKLHLANGFSGVLAVSKALIDYGCEVLAILDTDTRISGNDNRNIMSRIQSTGLLTRSINIVWMDSCMEDVLKKVDPGIQLKYVGAALQQYIRKYKEAILQLNEFRLIQDFINK